MLPRPKSIFDDADFCRAISTGAPPAHGPGSGFLYIVTKSLMVQGTDQGPGVLLVQEYMPGGQRHHKWGPPGGKSDATDHSALHAALREFGEEVGADWRNLGNANTNFRFVRLQTDQDRLNKQIGRAKELITTHNETATTTVIELYVLRGTISSTDEEAVRAALKGNAPGFYLLPYCTDPAELKNEDVKQKFEEGPLAYITVLPNGLPTMGKQLVGQPFTLSRTPSRMVARPPEFGEQTDEVLKEFGFGADEIANLKEARVV